MSSIHVLRALCLAALLGILGCDDESAATTEEPVDDVAAVEACAAGTRAAMPTVAADPSMAMRAATGRRYVIRECATAAPAR